MKNLFYLISAATIFLGSCKHNLELTPGIEDFKVDASSKVVLVNETVDFQLEGSPDIITFYSGELYNDYEFREGRIIYMDQADLSFTTSIPVVARPQENQFAVMASTDFNGNYSDYSGIDAATWVDITDRFTLATTITFTSAGVVDISDLIDPGKPLYIGFKYTQRTKAEIGNTANERPRQWHMQSFTLTGHTDAGPMVLGNMQNSGFNIIHQHPEIPSRSTMSATRVSLYGRDTDNIGAEEDIRTEIWAVSKPFQTGDIDMGPDRPIAIKADQNPPLINYPHRYEKAGFYKAYFVATNANVNESKQVIRRVNITVVD